MNLQAGADAPLILKAGAAALLYTHIGGAFAGLLTGGLAMVAQKGAPLHRAAGNAFCAAMLAMAGVGAAVAPFLPEDQVPNTTAGVLTLYLVATGWVVVKRKPGQIGLFEPIAFQVAALLAAVVIWVGLNVPKAIGGPGAGAIYIFAGVAALAAACDLRLILRGGIAGPARTARHLWRLSLALFVAAGSFAGQPKVIPHFLRGSMITLLPAFAVLAAMIYWLIRVRLPRKARPRPAPAMASALAGSASTGALPR